MKIMIEIPEEFICDYVADRFEDCLQRFICDSKTGLMAGNYERETADMLIKAFRDAEEVKQGHVDRKAVVDLIEQALKDCSKDYDPRLESFAEGLIEKIKKMDGPLDQSLRAAEPVHIEEPRIYPMEPIKPEDIPKDDYIGHLIDDAMEKWRENGGKLKIVLTYGGKEIGQIKIS